MEHNNFFARVTKLLKFFSNETHCAPWETISQISETDGEAVSPVASPCNAFLNVGDTEFLMPQQESVRPISGQVSAITLKPSLTSLGPGWKHVDTAVVCHFNL